MSEFDAYYAKIDVPIEVKARRSIVSQRVTGVKRTEVGSSPNAETIEAWDGPLYERFVRFKPDRHDRSRQPR